MNEQLYEWITFVMWNDVLNNWDDGWPYILSNEIVLRKPIMNMTTFIFTCSLLLDFWKKLEY
jgi:hypothetical protein